MKAFVVALSGLVAMPAHAEECPRFMHNYAAVVVEFQGGTAAASVTKWPTLIYDAPWALDPDNKGYRLSSVECAADEVVDVPVETHCYRGPEGGVDDFSFWVEADADGNLVLFDPNDDPGRAYTQACDVLDEIAKEDAAAEAQ